ncbi:helix-turn-helix transcriptional regulator [Streptomyces sp. 891-h]|uniref:helix-turn-helix domain-containing protein n=1 Tax=Streptomyces sp. 891-h TaxID=2720714 RepID=UPI001FAAE139|nr:helix-turn-helix transcriptional regulator [Streptomyces sp. 891-h]UNZ18186.1 helix-turn-helix domain-containing protein [Streptomyces sp. 891-h]
MTQKKLPPPVMRRRVGSLLRDYREQADLGPGAAAKQLGWDSTRQGRIERGIYRVTEGDIRKMLEAYGVHGDEEAVRELAAASNESLKSGWWASYVGQVSDALLDFVILESKAKKIQVQHPAIIPGLLQAPGYVREICNSPLHPDNWELSDMLSAVRMARQEVLHRPGNPVQLHALISEAALLHRFPSAPGVMKEQLRKLADDAGQPNITIQIVPVDVPAYTAANQAMTILNFRHPWPAAVSIDSALGGSFLDEPAEVSALSVVFEKIAELALPADESRDRINVHLEENF